MSKKERKKLFGKIFGVPTRFDPCITWLLLRSVRDTAR